MRDNAGGALPPHSPSKTGVNALVWGRVGVGVRLRALLTSIRLADLSLGTAA